MRDRGRRGGDRGAGGVLARQQVPRPGDDGTVLPILHLNGYKIANPTVLARIPDSELRALLAGYGHEPFFIEVDAGDDPMAAATLDRAPPVGDDQQIALMMGDVGPWLGEAHIYRVTTSEQGRVFGGYTVVVVG